MEKPHNCWWSMLSGSRNQPRETLKLNKQPEPPPIMVAESAPAVNAKFTDVFLKLDAKILRNQIEQISVAFSKAPQRGSGARTFEGLGKMGLAAAMF